MDPEAQQTDRPGVPAGAARCTSRADDPRYRTGTPLDDALRFLLEREAAAGSEEGRAGAALVRTRMEFVIEQYQRQTREGRISCPYCREWVDPQRGTCERCGGALDSFTVYGGLKYWILDLIKAVLFTLPALVLLVLWPRLSALVGFFLLFALLCLKIASASWYRLAWFTRQRLLRRRRERR